MIPDRWEQIQEICKSALKLEEGQRAGFLDQACSGDEGLRREVESLLQFARRGQRFIEEPALEVAARMMADEKPASLVGSRVGPYEILSLLGRGGMGEVYRTRDSRLDRIEALKILPLEVASDPDRLHRFIREAKAASALNHPNIATIYEIGESDAIHWIAMELVEGETLEERMKGKPLEVSEILDIGFQVAEGLEAAHRKGILHRDIKPANIMLTPQGQVKVLDFGLAKRARQEKPAEQRVASTESETTPGVIMGTAEYMSPEQVLGHEVDQRTDLFSLGVVLYNMVTGRLPFSGDSSTDTMYKILHAEPEAIAGSTGEIPVELEQIIKKCLEKDRGLRYQHASELCIDLKRVKRDTDSERVAALGVIAKLPQQAMKATALSSRWKWVVLSVVPLLLVGIGITWYEKGHLESPSNSVITPVPLTWYPGSEFNPSFSPDGTQVVFQWCTESPGENCDIYIKQIGVEPPFQLTTNPAFECCPAWSPDGRFIAFYRRNTETRKMALMLIPQRGGHERKLVESEGGYIPAWTPDSKWLVFSWRETDKANLGLFLISVETEEKRRLTSPPDTMSDIDAAVSPDGHTLAFTRGRGISSDIYLLHLAEGYLPQGRPEKIAEMGERSNWAPAWTPNGNEVVFLSRSVSDIGFWRVEMSNPTKLRRIVLASSPGVPSRFALSRQGNLLAYQVFTLAIGVSSDSGTILYPRDGPTNVDLMLVENFR